MSNFYSILYCPIRPNIGERISIALLVRTNDRVYFKYSIEKLHIVKDMIPQSAYSLLKSYLRNIQAYIHQAETRHWNSDRGPKPEHLNLAYTSEVTNFDKINDVSYFSYLSQYSNNLLNFSEPLRIDLNINEDLFDSFYRKFIYEFNTPSLEKKIEVEKVKKEFNPKIINRVNVDVELTKQDIPHLIIPTKVWFIGKNDVQVTGEIIDFNKKIDALENDLREHYYFLNTIRENEKNGKHGKHFVVGIEPYSKSTEVRKSLWNDFKDIKYLNLIPPSEKEEITEYLEKHNVKPFLTLN